MDPAKVVAFVGFVFAMIVFTVSYVRKQPLHDLVFWGALAVINNVTMQAL